MSIIPRVAPWVLSTTALIAALVCWAPLAASQGYAILPQQVTIEARSGASFTIPVRALSFSDEPIQIEIEHQPTAWTYEDSRGPSPLNARVDSVLQARNGNQADWFDFPEEFEIDAQAEDQTIPVTVNLPENVSGTYEGEFQMQEIGLDQLLTVGYRTSYQIVISNRPSYPLIDVEKSAFGWDEEGFSLDIGIKNTGNAALILGGEFQILNADSASRRAVLSDALEPATLSAGQTETVEQMLPADLPSGRYDVQVAPDIDGKRQRPLLTSATLVNAYEFGGTVGSSGISSVPNLLRAPIAPGARRNVPVGFTNAGDTAKTITLDAVEWLSGAPDHLSISMTPEVTTLQPGQQRSLRVMIVSGADYVPSPRPVYAALRLKVSDVGTAAEGEGHLVLMEIADTGFNPERALVYDNVRIISAPDNAALSILRYDIHNRGTRAETPLFELTLQGPGAIGRAVDARLFAHEGFIGPGQSTTGEVILPLPLSVFQNAVRENRAISLDAVIEPIEQGKRVEAVRITAKVEGLGLE